MDNKGQKFPFLNKMVLCVAGILIMIVLALTLLWQGNANSMQALPAMMAQVYFDGEYRIADGSWQKIEEYQIVFLHI